jgi:hypothetical protein
MTIYVFRALAVAAALAVVAPLGAVSAQESQDIQFASHLELNDIYTRLANLESRAASATIGDGCGADYGYKGGCDGGCYDRSGFVGGVEMLWLKGYHAEDDFENDLDYEIGFRAWAGWQAAGGLGARIRWFDYDADSDESSAEIDITHLDVEIYDAVKIGCNWDLNIGGGIRWMDYFDDDGGGDEGSLNGVGPVVTAELVRRVGCGGAVYAIVRDAIVVGDGDGTDNVCTNVFEIQLGLQAHTEWNGGLLFARLGWEGQYYVDNMEDDSEGIALAGGVLGIGLMR